MAATISVPNEEIGVSSRLTQNGRQLTYRLKVIQQPERARACGQGAKASSDRRPVDPPPIVELHILEGEEGQQHEVTFTHNANFFLFATLENARTIAQGRVPQSQQANTTPVLTGTPVAGMSYLDRPTPAGYFIFPDLSVRHEGKYRLSFTLYEELKDPKDSSNDSTEQDMVKDRGIGGHVHGRCEVRSAPFTVYSAKKFPGLAESTALSRTVADQGCRVRIRRDVRMRRRESKPGKDWDDEYDEAGDAAHTGSVEDDAPRSAISHQPSTATEYGDQPPSVSNAASSPYQPPSSRRPSIPGPSHFHQQHSQAQQPKFQHQDVPAPPAHQYQQPPPGFEHQYAQHPAPFVAHQAQVPPHYPPHAYPYPSAPMAHPGYNYMTPQPVYDHHSAPTVYGPHPPAPNYQHPPAIGPYPQVPAPLDFGRVPPPPPPPPATSSSSTQAHSFLPASTAAGSSQLPPLKTLDNTQTKTEPTSPRSAHNLSRQASYEFATRPAPPSQFVNVGGPAPKRSFGAVFNTQHIDQPLRSGARPDNCYVTSSQEVSEGSDEDMEIEQFKMTYRRANGEMIARAWPM